MIIHNPAADPGPGVCWLIITDGRPGYLEKMFTSWERNLEATIRHILIIDDSGDWRYRDWLEKHFGFADQIIHHLERIGYTETMRDAWSKIPKDCQYVLQAEDDFTLDRPIILTDWLDVMENNLLAVQLTAQRQPWYQCEKDIGGCLNAGGIEETVFMGASGRLHSVCKHRNQFTGNPSLYRQWLTTIGWPDEPLSEPKVMAKILAINPELHMLFWGKKSDPPLVNHFGARHAQQKGY